MAKDPALLFYTSDFLTETFFMSNEEKGQYITLICLQHQFGYLSKNDLTKIVNPASEKVLEKFVEIDGKFYNLKTKEEAERRRAYSESRKKNRQKTDNQSNGKNISKSYEKHMETETVTITDTLTNKEGGMGGDFETQKKYFLNDDAWKYKLCSAKNISKNEIEQLMEIFITDIELKQDFKSNKELKSHFTNWFNLKKKEHEKRNFNQYSKSSRGAQQLLELIRQERAAGL
jgi:uncharacterized protein YdaU (DUF1376 family)